MKSSKPLILKISTAQTMKSKQTKSFRFSSSQQFHARREKLIMKLLKGKASASRLQSLLRGPPPGEGPDPAELQRLTMHIVRSFTETLSEMGSCHGLSAQIAAVDCGGSASSVENSKKDPPAVKERRGCYKRRRNSDSWVEESSTAEDGWAWRKYGQKEILSSNYPRCYFRCSHKYDVGCKAIKQVQKIKYDPIIYQTTYFNRHTCNQQLNRQVSVGSCPVEPDLINFESNILQPKQDNRSLISTVISQVKQSDQDLDSEVNSTLQDPWQDLDVGLEPQCGLGSLHGLDEEVDQLGDIDYSWYDFD